MRRNELLDYAKGVLIVLVMIGHALQYAVYEDENFWGDPLYKAIYLFHMPLFMAISGFLAHAGIQRQALPSFALGKLKAYLIPIMAWAVLYKAGTYIALRDQSLGTLPETIFREAMNSFWFLWALLGCLLLTAGVKAIGRYFWALYVAALVCVLLLPEKGNVFMFKFMLPYFQAGYLAAAMGAFRWSRSRAMLVFALAAGCTAWVYSQWSEDTYIYMTRMALVSGNYENILLRYLGGFSASLTTMIAFWYICPKTPPLLKKGIEALGRDSIYIYMIQIYVFLLILNLAKRWYDPISHRTWGELVAVLAGVLIACLCWLLGKAAARSSFIGAVFFGKFKKSRRALQLTAPAASATQHPAS